MPRTETLQTNFSGGELSPELLMRQDTDQYQNGALSLRNFRTLIGGGVTRRPGTWLESQLFAASRCEKFIVNQTIRYVIAFRAGAMEAYALDVSTGDLTAAGSLNDCPWTGDIYLEMDTEQSANTMFITHPDMVTQVMTRTGAATWALADYAFYLGIAGRPEQPYLKVAPAAYTLQPSALTGSITLTIGGTTDPWFTSDHVGQYIRYLERACLITAVAADGLSVTATVIEQLPRTQQLTVGSSAFFAVGEVVEGSTTAAKGIIISIPDAVTIVVVLTEALTGFSSGPETLIGPNGTSAISAQAAFSPRAAVTDWDEQLFGPVYGYPGCVCLHRNRLLFGKHKTAPNYLLATTIGNYYNMNVGSGADGDAIIESIGDAQASSIVQLHSAEQLIVLTDHGPYYVPESKTSPFIPSSMAFFPFGSPWEVTETCKAHGFDGGVLFVSESLIVKARPTGNQQQQWDADDDVGVVSSHLISNPTRMAVVSNFAGGPERYAVFDNDDGTLAVLQLVEVQKIRNITPWVTDGTITSVVGIGRFLYATTERNIAGNIGYFLERFDQTITLDCATEYETAAIMDASVAARYGGTTANVVAGGVHYGTWPISVATVPEGPFVVGLRFDPTLETLPPVVSGPNGPKAGDLMRIMETLVDTRNSARFTQDGYTLSAYSLSDDTGDVAPLKTGPQRFTNLGWVRNPTVTITQEDPLPLTIRSIKMKVAH